MHLQLERSISERSQSLCVAESALPAVTFLSLKCCLLGPGQITPIVVERSASAWEQNE